MRDVRHAALIGLVVAARPALPRQRRPRGERRTRRVPGDRRHRGGLLTLDGRHLHRAGPCGSVRSSDSPCWPRRSIWRWRRSPWRSGWRWSCSTRVPTRRAVIALAVLALGILAPLRPCRSSQTDLARSGNLTPMVEAMINRRAGRARGRPAAHGGGHELAASGRELVGSEGTDGRRLELPGARPGGWSTATHCSSAWASAAGRGRRWGDGGRVFRSAMTPAACAALAAELHGGPGLSRNPLDCRLAASRQQTPGTPPPAIALAPGPSGRRCTRLAARAAAIRRAGVAGPGVHRRRGHGHLGRDDHDLRRRPRRLGGPGTARRALQPPGLGTATLFAATSVLRCW